MSTRISWDCWGNGRSKIILNLIRVILMLRGRREQAWASMTLCVFRQFDMFSWRNIFWESAPNFQYCFADFSSNRFVR